MHNNFYTLRKLSQELEQLLKGSVISECYSQNKEELIIRFEIKEKSFFIKANLQPDFSCLAFPEVFHRARKNSVDLFPNFIGRTVEGVRQFNNERSFALQLSQDYALLFKMHGNRSNILLFHHKEIESLFRNNLHADEEIVLDALDKDIAWGTTDFSFNKEAIKKHFFTFGKHVWDVLEEEGFFLQDTKSQEKRLQDLSEQLKKPVFYITEYKNTIVLSLFPVGNIIKQHIEATQALTDFYNHYQQRKAFEQEKAKAEQKIKHVLKSTAAYLLKTGEKLIEVQHDQHYKIWADVLMANMHQVKQGAEKVKLPNFYDNGKSIEIKLKQDLSPQKNAEVFYRKSKNQQVEIDRLTAALIQKEQEKEKLEILLAGIRKAGSLKELRELIQIELPESNRKEQEVSLPYHEFIFKDYTIWVGRNAQANDVLTLKYAFKEDLWLHAKDVAGSHVLIKHKAGKPYPKDVIERAAELAAYNSKRKTESLVPVTYTSKKFVRKRKGDPAGMVVVEKEEVILVSPKL